MKTRLLPILLLTATFPFAALAQTSTGESSSSGDQGATSEATTPGGTGALSTGGSPSTDSAETFATIPNSGTWRLADLQGKTVYSVDGSNIGEINDVLVSQNGSVNAVIIGSGGFLGIGEKNVAVNISALQVAPSQMTGATGTTGSDMSANSAGTSSAQSNMASAADNRIILSVTRNQLESAPTYQRMGSQP